MNVVYSTVDDLYIMLLSERIMRELRASIAQCYDVPKDKPLSQRHCVFIRSLLTQALDDCFINILDKIDRNDILFEWEKQVKMLNVSSQQLQLQNYKLTLSDFHKCMQWKQKVFSVVCRMIKLENRFNQCFNIL